MYKLTKYGLCLLSFSLSLVFTFQRTSLAQGKSTCDELIAEYKYESAILCLQNELLKLSGLSAEDRSRLNMKLGDIYLEILQPYEAIQGFLRSGTSLESSLKLGHAYFLMENYNQAERHYKKVTGAVEAEAGLKATANFFLANLFAKRFEKAKAEISGYWRQQKSTDLEELSEKAWGYYSLFLKELKIATASGKELDETYWPFVLLVEANYTPPSELDLVKKQLEETLQSTDSTTMTFFLASQILADVKGEEYLQSISEYVDASPWLAGGEHGKVDTLSVVGVDSQFGNRGLYRAASVNYKELMKRFAFDARYEAFLKLKFGNYNLKVVSAFDLISGASGPRPTFATFIASSNVGVQRYLLNALEAYHDVLRLVAIDYDNEDINTNPDLSQVPLEELESSLISRVLFKEALSKKAYTLYQIANHGAKKGNDSYTLHLLSYQVGLKTIMTLDWFLDQLLLTMDNENDKFFYASKIKDDRLFAIDFNFIKFASQPRDKVANSKTFNFFLSLNASEHTMEAHNQELKDAFHKPDQFIEPVKNGYRINRSTDSTFLHLAYYFAEKTKAYSLLTSMAQSRFETDFSLHKIKLGSLSKIQDALDEKTAVIEYIFTDDYLYRFNITRDYFTLVRLRRKSEEDVAREVTGIRNGILYYQDELYVKNSFALQEKLLPKYSKRTTNLVIIPDGLMYMVPFEALLTKKVGSNNPNFGKLPYLINRYNISYAFSGSLYHINQAQKKDDQQNGFLGFAPVFSDDIVNDQVTFRRFDSLLGDSKRAILKNGTYVSPLPGTESEVNVIARMLSDRGLQSKVFIHQEADEASIKSTDLASYKYVHIATHGFVNTDDPEKSGLLFYPNKNSSEDGVLYGKEIYNMDINADLVILSACETGLGKVISGEGLIGLTRAFQYAGARNQLVSMWKVSDNSTSQLMQNFYSYLIENPDAGYSDALSNVKRQMLTSGKWVHPYFWSPFVLMGR